MNDGLIYLHIRNFRSIASLEVEINGNSVTMRGDNGTGKSSAIDAFYWALGGTLEGEVIRNGEDSVAVDTRFDDYVIARKVKRGGPTIPSKTLVVKSVDGLAKYNPEVLRGLHGAIERRTFSTRSPKERAEILRKLAPGLDTADLDGERVRVFAERTDVNREVKSLRAQAEGVAVPEAGAQPGEERDLAAIASKKAGLADVRAAHDRLRAAAAQAQRDAYGALDGVTEAERQVIEAEKMLAARRAELELRRAQVERLAAAAKDAASAARDLIDPDTSAVDREVAEAKAHNAAVRAAQQRQADHLRAVADRQRLNLAAATRDTAAKKLTDRLSEIEAEKVRRTSTATLPIKGIALSGETVTFDDGEAGPVEFDSLNTAKQIRLDTLISAAQGNRVIAVRNVALVNSRGREELARFAKEHGVRLIAEMFVEGEPLTAVIEEAPADGEQSPLF